MAGRPEAQEPLGAVVEVLQEARYAGPEPAGQVDVAVEVVVDQLRGDDGGGQRAHDPGRALAVRVLVPGARDHDVPVAVAVDVRDQRGAGELGRLGTECWTQPAPAPLFANQ